MLLKVAAAGDSRNSWEWDLEGLTKIVQILATHSSHKLHSLQFTFLNDDGTLRNSGIIGSSDFPGGSLNVITFKGGGEYVTEVEGLTSITGDIWMLSIHTNIKVYQVFLAECDLTNRTKFSFNFGGLDQFGGFHGFQSDHQVKSIGVYVKQLRALPPNFTSSTKTELEH